MPVRCVVHADEQGCQRLLMSRVGVTMGLQHAAQVTLSWEAEVVKGRFAYGLLGTDVLGSFSVYSIESMIPISMSGTESVTIVNARDFVLCFEIFLPNRVHVHLGFYWLPLRIWIKEQYFFTVGLLPWPTGGNTLEVESNFD